MTLHKAISAPKTLTIVHDETVEACIGRFRNAIYEGTDALGIMINTLSLEERSEEKLKDLFNYAGNKPVLAMNYRDQRPGIAHIDDISLIDNLLLSVKAGADMVDLMGDLYDENEIELSTDDTAIQKQQDLVKKIQSMGAKVLMSSHVWRFMNSEEVIEHFLALQSRGADMVKIAMCVNSEEELDEAFRTTLLLKYKLNVPFIFICMGQYGKRHRLMAPMMGAEYALCVQEYTADSHREQVLLRNARAVYTNTDWTLARDTTTSTIRPV